MDSTTQPRQTFRFQKCLLAIALTVALAGCRVGKQPPIDGVTLSDHLMDAYPELRSGFATIADFEDPTHMELLQIIGVSENASCIWKAEKGRRRTGGTCAVFTAGSNDDSLVIGNEAASKWYMKRDWRPYDLLMMSVHSPRENLGLKLLVTAGPDENRLAVETDIALGGGWNLVRLDLAELADHIPLDDIYDIRISPNGVRTETEFIFDDILLTRNTEKLLGSPDGPEGELYVQRVGRRWKVGTPQKFELTFSHGQIVDWYHLGSDPYRLHNLVRDTTLGPSPVVVADTDQDDESPIDDFTGLGKTVRARQRIVEMSPARVVLACQWFFTNSDSEDVEDAPFHRWTYTIYPSGQIYASISCTARTAKWTPPQLGLAVSLASPLDYNIYVHNISQLDSPEMLRHLLYATARSLNKQGAFLLYCAADSHTTPRMFSHEDQVPNRLNFVATGPLKTGTVHEWYAMLTLASSHDIPAIDVVPRALNYAQPPELLCEVGTPVTAADNRQGVVGFDPGTGCYNLRADRGEVRFTIPALEHPVYSPAFCIQDSKNLQAWIYVDHLVLESHARDADGNLIFQIPGTLNKNTLVDVLLREPPTGE